MSTHYERARELNLPHDAPVPESAEIIAAFAQVEATLAIAEQLRIANLIALANGETAPWRAAYEQLVAEKGVSPAALHPSIARALRINDKEKQE